MLVVQPCVIHTPTYPIAKSFPNFLIVFSASSQTFIDAFLHRKAETSVTVFYPKLVNSSQVFTGKLIDIFNSQPAILCSPRCLQHLIRRFLIRLLPLSASQQPIE